MVIVSVWGEVSSQFLAALAIYFAWDDFEESDGWIHPFLSNHPVIKIVLGKTACAARNLINSSPPNTSDNLCLCLCLYSYSMNTRYESVETCSLSIQYGRPLIASVQQKLDNNTQPRPYCISSFRRGRVSVQIVVHAGSPALSLSTKLFFHMSVYCSGSASAPFLLKFVDSQKSCNL